MNNGPELWRDLLLDCPENSVLMGGAVVDYVAGVPPKDFDIYYSRPPGDHVEHIVPDWVASPGIVGEDYNNNRIVQVTNFLVANTHKVQLIRVDLPDPRKFIKTFDHSLTLGLFSLEHGLRVSPKVFRSLYYNSVQCTTPPAQRTFIRQKKSLARAMAKVARYDPEGIDDWTYLNF